MTDTITLPREVVQDALLALESKWTCYETGNIDKSIQALKAALAAPLSPENVAKAFRETFLQALAEPPPETETTRTVDRSWAQFCAGIGDSKDAPYPGMIAAFESHYGQSFADKDWRNEASVWAQAWQAAIRAQTVQPDPLSDRHAAELKALSMLLRNMEGPVTLSAKKIAIAEAIEAAVRTGGAG